MPRLLLSLLIICSLIMTFGCAMRQTPVSPIPQPPNKKGEATVPTVIPEKDDDPFAPPHQIVVEPIVDPDVRTDLRSDVRPDVDTPPPVALQVVHYDYDKAELSDKAKNIIAENVKILKTMGGVKFKLAGYCDERGADQYNIALGEERAKAVQTYLLNLDIDAGQIVGLVSYGEDNPVDAGHDENAWMKNRRVEFILLP